MLQDASLTTRLRFVAVKNSTIICSKFYSLSLISQKKDFSIIKSSLMFCVGGRKEEVSLGRRTERYSTLVSGQKLEGKVDLFEIKFAILGYYYIQIFTISCSMNKLIAMTSLSEDFVSSVTPSLDLQDGTDNELASDTPLPDLSPSITPSPIARPIGVRLDPILAQGDDVSVKRKKKRKVVKRSSVQLDTTSLPARSKPLPPLETNNNSP